jgi:hypothetical protein
MNLAQQGATNSEFGDIEIRDIVIRSYTIVGMIEGIGRSSVQVEAREAIVPDRQIAAYSVRLEFKSGGDYPQTSVASIQYDNLQNLIIMLQKMEMVSISTDRFKFSEIEYEVDDFKTIVFNTERGGLMVALSSGIVSIHLNVVSKIGDFVVLLNRAKEIIDKNKRSF